MEDRQREIINDMARTYNRSVGKLQATFDAIKKQVLTSWLEKAWNKLKAIVNAIIDFATRIAELLGRMISLLGDIVSSPRYFFKNLVTGIAQGFSTFVDRIDEYLAGIFRLASRCERHTDSTPQRLGTQRCLQSVYPIARFEYGNRLAKNGDRV